MTREIEGGVGSQSVDGKPVFSHKFFERQERRPGLMSVVIKATDTIEANCAFCRTPVFRPVSAKIKPTSPRGIIPKAISRPSAPAVRDFLPTPRAQIILPKTAQDNKSAESASEPGLNKNSR